MIIGATLIIVGAFFGFGGVNYLSDILFINEPIIPVIITDKDLMLNMTRFNFYNYEEWKEAKQNIILELNTINTVLMSEQSYSESTYEAEKKIYLGSYFPYLVDQNYIDMFHDGCDNTIEFQNEKMYNEYINGYTYKRIEECINKGKVVDFFWETMINNVNVKI